ncbi:uncharacterized protein [Pithys albifrons albifrons]|uniref:uncharacterized protein n=1 Tax=Pithys albifrons albifrons TaxID=3385563 RepID=UPI003A5CB4D7
MPAVPSGPCVDLSAAARSKLHPGRFPPPLRLLPNSKQALSSGRHRSESILGGPPVTRPRRQPAPFALPRLQGHPRPPIPRKGTRRPVRLCPHQNHPGHFQKCPQTRHPRPARGRRSARRTKPPAGAEGEAAEPPLLAAAGAAARAGGAAARRSHLHPPRCPRFARLCRPPACPQRLLCSRSPPATALPPPPCPVGSRSCVLRLRSKTPVTKGWSPCGGGHPHLSGDRALPAAPLPARDPGAAAPGAALRG